VKIRGYKNPPREKISTSTNHEILSSSFEWIKWHLLSRLLLYHQFCLSFCCFFPALKRCALDVHHHALQQHATIMKTAVGACDVIKVSTTHAMITAWLDAILTSQNVPLKKAQERPSINIVHPYQDWSLTKHNRLKVLPRELKTSSVDGFKGTNFVIIFFINLTLKLIYSWCSY